jgi:hypothetical protein
VLVANSSLLFCIDCYTSIADPVEPSNGGVLSAGDDLGGKDEGMSRGA